MIPLEVCSSSQGRRFTKKLSEVDWNPDNEASNSKAGICLKQPAGGGKGIKDRGRSKHGKVSKRKWRPLPHPVRLTAPHSFPAARHPPQLQVHNHQKVNILLENVRKNIKTSDRHKTFKRKGYSQRFDPSSEQEKRLWNLPYSIGEYVLGNFSKCTKDSTLQQTVLHEHLVPNNVAYPKD